MKEQFLERKLVELRRTLAWMDEVMANVNESILVLDESWRVVFVNDAFAELLDQDRIALLGKTFWDIMPVTKNGKRLQIATSTERATIETISSMNGAYDIKTRNVPQKMMLISKYVGGLQQAVCVMSDVSIEVNAENALMDLQRQVEDLKAQLMRTTKNT